MPAAIAIPLIGAAASAATNLVGAKMASSASKAAAQTQSASADRAMQLEREGQTNALNAINQNYGRAAGLYDPYMNVGRSVMPSLTALAGSNYNRGGSPIYQPTTQPSAPSLATAPAAGQTVTMRSPDGRSTRAVPASQVEYYRQRGAMVIQ